MRRAWPLLALLLAALGARAQQAQVHLGPGPFHVDVPVPIQVIADGFQPSPEPAIQVDTPPGADLAFKGVSPSVSSRIQIVNGQVTREEKVRFVYRYQLLARRTGSFEVGPFRITQGQSTASTGRLRVEVQEMASADDQRFGLVLPEGPFWVGQRVPVSVEWWLTEDFAQRLAGRRARVPLFDRLDWLRFEDEAVPDARNTLLLDTAAGPLELPVSVQRREWQGQPYLVVSGRRTMVALRAGEVVVEPATLVVEEAVRWSRDWMGTRVPEAVRTLRIGDQPRTLVFRSPPAEGRPASFSGAVGKGFSIEVSADRSVVRAGDPIRLTLDVRGEAALETVSLPRLTDSGLPAADFKIPEGPGAGIIEGGAKRFEVTLRVNHEGVSAVPPIELSWFDPELGRYESTRSRPIALSVRPANRISAEDVVSAAATDGAGTAEPGGAAAGAGGTPAAESRPAFTLSGADLAIETRPERLAANPVPAYARPAAVGGMYLATLACLVLGAATRRRAARDPAARERRQTLDAARQAVSRAHGAGELARALRPMAAAAPHPLRAELDALLEECENLAYAPDAGADPAVDGPLKARALGLSDRLLETAR